MLPCYRNWEVHFTFKRDEPTPQKKNLRVRRYLLSSLVWRTLAMVPCRCLQPHATQLTPVGTDFPRICVGSGDTYLWQIKIDKEDKENGLFLSRPYKSILFVCSGTYSLPSITDISLQEQDIKSRQQTLWVFVEERGREGGHHSHNNTTNVTAKVNWNQWPPEHHEGWMVGSRF